jgi:hypothetical protein
MRSQMTLHSVFTEDTAVPLSLGMNCSLSAFVNDLLRKVCCCAEVLCRREAASKKFLHDVCVPKGKFLGAKVTATLLTS